MSLSCSCDYEPEPGDTFWYSPQNFTLYRNSRATKCVSCGDKINHGDDCAEFQRVKIPETKVEIRIYGEDGEIPRASYYHCYRCAGLYFP